MTSDRVGPGGVDPSPEDPDGEVRPAGPLDPTDGSRGAPRRASTAEALAATCFLAAAMAAIALAVVYWQGGQTQLEGLLLAVSTGSIGVGIVVWAKRFMPDEEAIEPREPLPSSDEEIAAFAADFDHGEQSLVGRRALVASFATAMGALGAALLFPIRSLGPRPGRGLKRTAYAAARGKAGGVRLVRESGDPIKPEELPPDGVVTAFPQHHTDDGDAPTLLIRTRSSQQLELPDGREDWVVEGIVAYSKLCTHVGCPVGLYQSGEGLLLCPCHQSTFDVLHGAEPVFGPAARALPQLPLAVDDDGYLVATDDFSGPVGPGFWDRER